MITKVYYLDKTTKGYKQRLEHIKKAIPCFTSAKPCEFDFVEWTFEVRKEDVPALEKMLAPLV